MRMLPQNFVSHIVDVCGSNNMLRITVKAMDFKNNLKKMKVHCEAVIIGPACCKFHVKKRLWAKTWAQAANKENNQAWSEQEVFTAGRENRISFTHSWSRINPGSKAFTAIPRCWLQGTLYSDWFWKKKLKTQTVVNSYFSRCLWSVSAGQSPFSLLPLLRPFLKRLLSEPRLLPLSLQPTAARCHPQLWEEVWFHAEGNPGVRLWQWHLHRLSHGLGKAFKHFFFKQTLLNDHSRCMILF